MIEISDRLAGRLWIVALLFAAMLVGILAIEGVGDANGEFGHEQSLFSQWPNRSLDEFSGEMPQEWEVHVTGKRGWLKTGQIPMSFDEACVAVRSLMRENGCQEEHEVGDGINASSLLVQFASPSGVKSMWMLWRMDDWKTGFSWGISK